MPVLATQISESRNVCLLAPLERSTLVSRSWTIIFAQTPPSQKTFAKAGSKHRWWSGYVRLGLPIDSPIPLAVISETAYHSSHILDNMYNDALRLLLII